MKKICNLVMLLAVIGSVVIPIKAEAAVGCSNFYSIDIEYDPYCEEKRCGFLWLEPQTQYQDSIWERKCEKSNGEVYYDLEIRTEKIGCC